MVERLHTDTTSVSLYGMAYADDPEVAIARGFSKDRHPDPLRFKIGSQCFAAERRRTVPGRKRPDGRRLGAPPPDWRTFLYQATNGTRTTDV